MGRFRGFSLWLAAPFAALVINGGCATQKRVEPSSLANTFGPVTIAVAPAVNQSGSTDFEADRFADLMAMELATASQVRVTPVSRVLAVLHAEGHDTIVSPEHAGRVARTVGADAILIFAVTQFYSYDPPQIAMTALLYGTAASPEDGSSAEEYRGPQPTEVEPWLLLASSQQVLDASNDAVVADLRNYASTRDADASPYGWRKYIVSQQHFMKYCCHAILRDILAQGPAPLRGQMVRDDGVNTEGTP